MNIIDGTDTSSAACAAVQSNLELAATIERSHA